jgi:hypothetical protein
LERLHFPFQVVAQQKQLMYAVLIGWMKRGLARRQSEDEPALTRIDRPKAEDITKELSVRFRIRGVDDDMCASNHLILPTPSTPRSEPFHALVLRIGQIKTH